MTKHKAFEILGQRVSIINSGGYNNGIFQMSRLDLDAECDCCNEPIKVIADGTIDFVKPLYRVNVNIERLAKGRIPVDRINPKNPILHFFLGVSLERLTYITEADGSHLFAGEIHGPGFYINDGNSEFYDHYRMPLKNAGFNIE